MEAGVVIPPTALIETHQLRDAVQRLEGPGYHSAWVVDHSVPPERVYQTMGEIYYESFILLSHIVACSERLRLGTTVLVTPYRNPLVMGKMLASLGSLSGGTQASALV